MADVFEPGDRVKISDEQARIMEDHPNLWPDLDPNIEMTIIKKMKDTKNERFSIFWAWSDPCPCCGHRKQQMQNFAGLWFKKVEVTDA